MSNASIPSSQSLGRLERVLARLNGHRRIWLCLALTLQLIVLVSMIVLKAGPLLTGDIVWLRVVPVDPRDMFRGDYVTLSYDFSSTAGRGFGSLPLHINDDQNALRGRTMYALLKPEEDGKHWKLDRFSLDRPTGGKYIRGTITGWNRVEYGIESYYVQEGEGRKYEDAARQQQLSAEVAIASDGRATLRRLHTGSTPPPARPAYDNMEKHRWPSNTTYRVRRLPHAKEITLDGRLDEPQWSRANVERHFTFPWKKADAPATEFSAFCDDQYLYFGFRVEDNDIVTLDKLRDKEDEMFEDRVELYFSRDDQMNDYYCLEIDSRGRVLDYCGKYYRQLDMKWHCEGVEAAGVPTAKGYAVEGRIPLARLKEMGLQQQVSLNRDYGERILCGLYRAEFSHDRSGKPVEQRETLHTRGRKPEGPPPIEEWISWIDPNTPEPDFHVPSSLGWLEIVK